MRYTVNVYYKMSQTIVYNTNYILFHVFIAQTNPRPFVNSLLGKEIIARSKWGQKEYRGYLISVDVHLNLRLANTKELIDGDYASSLEMGDVFIRGNSILYIRGVMEQHNNSR